MKVGVIGAGTMGSGIAQAFAQTEGYEVYLCDINDEFAANGKKKIAKGFEKRVARGKMDQAKADAILAKITTGTKDICTDADLVVEAALEVMEVKQQTFKELQDIVPATCMFATNTSSLSITQIGPLFFSPPLFFQIRQFFHRFQPCRCRRPAESQDIRQQIRCNRFPRRVIPGDFRKQKVQHRLHSLLHRLQKSGLLCNPHHPHPECRNPSHHHAQTYCLLRRLNRRL